MNVQERQVDEVRMGVHSLSVQVVWIRRDRRSDAAALVAGAGSMGGKHEQHPDQR